MSASQNLKANWKNVPTRTITADGVEFSRAFVISWQIRSTRTG
jgi:hypothetical protein